MGKRLRLVAMSGMLGLLGLVPGQARGDLPATVTLPIRGYFDMVVDNAHEHIFVTGQPNLNQRMVVIDYHGTVVKLIEDEEEAGGLALDPDHSSIYVTLRTPNAIAAIDTGSLEETARFALGPEAGCPGYATFIGGRVWFGYTCGTGPNRVGIGSLDPATGTVATFGGSTFPHHMPVVRSSPALTDSLFASAHWPGKGSIVFKYRINVDGSLTFLASADAGADYVYDLRVTLDGLDVMVAACLNGGDDSPSYRATDLILDQTYYSGCYPSAIAPTDDGSVVATTWFECGSTDVFMHHRRQENFYKVFFVPPPPLFVYPGGIAFNETASLLFTVGTDYGAEAYFTVFPHPTTGSSIRKLHDMMP